MKEFKDFISTLSESEITKITQTINSRVKDTRENTSNSNELLGNQVGVLAYFMCLELLSRYHDWNNS